MVVLAGGGSLAFGLLLSTPTSFSAVRASEIAVISQQPVENANAADTTLLTVSTENVEIPIQPTVVKEERSEEEQVLSSAKVPQEEKKKIDTTEESVSDVYTVPFYSQFNDITSTSWKKVGCGIASLAMLIEFHEPGELSSVDTLLQEGIDADAYLNSAGWTYAGLIGISKKYGLNGETHDFAGSSMEAAFAEFKKALTEGPVMASVHYTFKPTNPIPHLVIVNGVEDGMVYYNDPAEKKGGGSVSVEQFKSAWKKRYIEFYPTS